MAVSAPTLSQLSCFSSINRRNLHLHRRPILFPSLPLSRSKLSIVMSVEGGGHGMDTSSSDIKTNTSVESKSYMKGAETAKPHNDNNTDPAKVYGAAKIHDFCFGIPYGGLVLSGGLLGFLFSRNPTILSTGVLYGGALLALSFLSLKIWRQGKSSIPFVLGQAVLSAALSWKHFQAYSLTKKLIPTGFYAVISAAMLCFFSYVMISGGNPPPKKLQSSTVGS
ncbi:protein FATTY ACID EXPORT 1, chloroplastic [Ricinus communis]|uniref:Transmembrane protein 14, putative n=1 Tax=Ricinus communis TaxID=3988 RepID=B9T353_RICCO|nr:protein FATTY ACID EXPORT 1, chloroplastic [Ricinus communis]EEF29719.1 transmembrane protein 14, putative [Ricinus communis]|eukprot:XP_002532672.1 protein FATTY ACID EXPORT 1, chloroplastic [Ricinus communis]